MKKEIDQSKLRNAFKGRVTDYGCTQEQIDASENHRQVAQEAVRLYRIKLAEKKLNEIQTKF